MQANSNQSSRTLLGGWLIQDRQSEDLKQNTEVVIGYCMEKINSGFQVLRQMSTWQEELSHTTRKMRLTDGDSTTDRKKKKEALNAFKQAIIRFQKEQNVTALRKLTESEEIMDSLPFSEKGLLFLMFIQRNGSGRSEHQNIALNVASNAADVAEFNQLLELAGGKEILKHQMREDILGRFLCLLERFELERWEPPFQKSIFTKSFDSISKIDQEPYVFVAQSLLKEEYVSGFLNGETSAAAMFGLSNAELFQIAQRGYQMIQTGKLRAAVQIFDGLIYLQADEPYFYAALGSIRQQQGDIEGALLCYQKALELKADNINSLANRGEIFFIQGKFTEALEDFHKVIALDSEAINPSTLRVRFLLAEIQENLTLKEKAN
jgi:tetratricopeptide (TPR) repeat protein